MSVGHQYVFFGKKLELRSSAHILIALLIFILSCVVYVLWYIYMIYIYLPYMFWISTFYLKYCLPNISSHSINHSSVGDALLCFIKVLYCDWVPIVYFYFCFICLRRQIQKIILRLISKCLLPTFSSMTFTFSGFTYKSLKHVEFIFAYGMRK